MGINHDYDRHVNQHLFDQNELFQYLVEEAEARAMFFAWIFGVQ